MLNNLYDAERTSNVPSLKAMQKQLQYSTQH